MTNPYGAGPEQPRKINGVAVFGGIVIGVVVTVVWLAVVFVAALSQENTNNGTLDTVWFVLLLLPLPVAVVLLCLRRTRQAGAGLVMGMAIGTLVLAGLCSGIVALPNLGA